jgi:hypothetical protein|tara:strand:- start:2004 stop:2363 length:360 start_codon:yes stop_codon:yes gene_type:complete
MASQKDILQGLVADIQLIKTKLPNGEVKKIENQLTQIVDNQVDMKDDIRGLRVQILDPEKGIIVKLNKNTDFREKCEPDREAVLEQFKAILRWKGVIDKALWVLFSGMAGVVLKLIFFT